MVLYHKKEVRLEIDTLTIPTMSGYWCKCFLGWFVRAKDFWVIVVRYTESLQSKERWEKLYYEVELILIKPPLYELNITSLS